MVQTKYGKPVAVPGPWTNLGAIRDANAGAGRSYFSPDTLRFFKSRPLPTIYAGRFFVDSVVPPDGRRCYQINAADNDGDVERVEPEGMPEFGYRSRRDAIRALSAILAEEVTA